MQTIDNKHVEITTYSSLMYDLKSRLMDYNYQVINAQLESDKEIAELQLYIDTYQPQDELKKELQELEYSLNNCIIYAPCDGIVNEIYVSSGQISNEKSIATIVQTDNKKIHAYLNDNDIMLVEEGMNVDVILGQYSLEGNVTRINHIKNENGFDIYIDLEYDDKLSIGLSVSNSINIINKDVLSVSKDALLIDNGNYYVMVAVPQSDGSYIKESKSVTVGVQDDEYIEICSGISKGDLVIIDEDNNIADGEKVGILTNDFNG